jgi:arylformamidase
MPLYDVSVPICATTPTYPGDPSIEITKFLTLEDGDPANVSFFKFGAHTGTHVDAPAHFFKGGARVESLPLDVLIGEAHVVEVPFECRVIDESMVREVCSSPVSRILFKTRNSDFWTTSGQAFRADYTYIDPTAAQYLVEHDVKLVGIDYLSVERFESEDFATHRLLLSHDVVIVEGLDLRDVPAGRYELICLPLRVSEGSGDGAPARAVLRTIGSTTA